MKIRCLAKKDGDLWVAMSLDFGLAAQADTLENAKAKLDAQIEDYIKSACSAHEKHKKELLSRKGPLNWFVTYYFFLCLIKCHISITKTIQAFTETKPSCSAHA